MQTSELIFLRSDSTSFTWLSSGVASRFHALEEPFAEKSRVARDSGDRGISSNLDWSLLVLKRMDPNVRVKLTGRYDVGVGSKSRMKNMPNNSDLHLEVHKEALAF